VDGRELKGDGDTFVTTNPATAKHEVLATVSGYTAKDVDKAVNSARKGFEKWSAMSGHQRGDILRNAASLLRSRRHLIVEMEMQDTGHAISEIGPGHVDMAIDTLEYYGNLAPDAHEGHYIPLPNGNFTQVHREPYGVVAAIVAWNYPFQMALYKAAISLAAGNSVVMKPSSKTPINTVGLAKIFHEAGLPDGAFNVVQGGETCGTALVKHPLVDKVSFTGSTGVGGKVLEMCAPLIRPTTVELGGKSPLIIFPDADLNNAVQAAMIANFVSAGQICTNGTRVFVHEKVYDEFLEKFIIASGQLRVGDPSDPSTQVGSLIDVNHANSVRSFISEAKLNPHLKLACGDAHVEEQLPSHLDPQAFVPPTIFSNVTDDSVLATTEIFGPVASVFKFSDQQEVIDRANNTPFGLASGVFTKDINTASRVSRKLKAGVCWINNYNVYYPQMPVGGYKTSGFGREFGREALDHVTQTKSVCYETGDIPEWQ